MIDTVLDPRALIAAQIVELEAQRDAALAPLLTQQATAYRAVEELQPRYNVAIVAWRGAQARTQLVSADFTGQIERLRAALRATADGSVIDAAVDELRALFDQLLQMDVETFVEGLPANPAMNRPGPTTALSNLPAITARREAILDGIRAAEAMRADVDQTTLPERLAAIIAALPPATEFSQVTIPAR